MYQYSFANVDLLLYVDWKGNNSNPHFKVDGFMAGENLITIARKAPIAVTTFGAYGDMVVSMQRIKAGDLVFPVLMNSPENEALQNWSNHFQEIASSNGELVIPIQATLRDNMGKDTASLTNGVILEMPAMIRGQTMNTVTWIITFEEVHMDRKVGEDRQNITV